MMRVNVCSDTGVDSDSLGYEAWGSTRSLVACFFEQGARPLISHPSYGKQCVPFHNQFICLRKDTRPCETDASPGLASCGKGTICIETVFWDGHSERHDGELPASRARGLRRM